MTKVCTSHCESKIEELGEPLLVKDSNGEMENNKLEKIIKKSEVQINFLWLFVGLILGLFLQCAWTSGIFMTLAVLATQCSAQTALAIVSCILFIQCLCLNACAYRVVSKIDEGDTEEQYEELEAQAKKEGFNVKKEIVLRDYTPVFELMLGGVFGMFFMAVALQVAPMLPEVMTN